VYLFQSSTSSVCVKSACTKGGWISTTVVKVHAYAELALPCYTFLFFNYTTS
jgi:hypothetical protein